MKRFLIPIFLLLLVFQPVTYGYDWDDYSFSARDPKDDVGYWDWEDFEIYLGPQRSDIDLTYITIIRNDTDLRFSLFVNGKINTGPEYFYRIGAHYYHIDLHEHSFYITFTDGYTLMTYWENDTTYNLTRSTVFSENRLDIFVPISILPNYEIEEIDVLTSVYDENSQRSYIDSLYFVEPTKKMKMNTYYLLMSSLLLVIGIGFTIRMLFWKKIRPMVRSIAYKKCHKCGVKYRRGVKKCAYCEQD